MDLMELLSGGKPKSNFEQLADNPIMRMQYAALTPLQRFREEWVSAVNRSCDAKIPLQEFRTLQLLVDLYKEGGVEVKVSRPWTDIRGRLCIECADGKEHFRISLGSDEEENFYVVTSVSVPLEEGIEPERDEDLHAYIDPQAWMG